MKYLAISSFFILAACSNERKLTAADVLMARCLCQKYEKLNVRYIEPYTLGIAYRCEGQEKESLHPDRSYTEGCSSL